MKTDNIQDIYELSPIQQGILFHGIYAPESGFYFVQKIFTLRGELNFVAFNRAWQAVVARHTSLRTGFYWEDINKPLQVVYQKVEVSIEQQNWQELTTVEQQLQFESFLKRDRHLGFDLSQECLMRLTLFRLGKDDYKFVWTSHFINMDGWSVALVLSEFVQLYEAFCQERDLSLTPGSSFKNYITWLQQQDFDKAETFWREQLKGLQAPTPLTNLYVNQSDPEEQNYDYQRSFLSQTTTTALKSLARKHQLTLNTLIQATWALLLSRYTGKQKVVYGYTTAGRPVDLIGVESMVGMTINSLPVWVEVDEQQQFLTWSQQLQKQLVEMRQYEYSPLVEIQGWTELPRDLPLFESLVVFEKVPMLSAFQISQGELEIEMTDILYKTNYPLNIVIYPFAKLTLEISFDCSRFDAVTIKGILQHFAILLEGIVSNPQAHLQDLSWLTPTEQEFSQILEREATFNFAPCS
ncbi:MAG: non-ribosomal peptide synthetase [Pleurocapsa sp. SU_5_0]|nr:non-ribosomal peptide synthetase [Pleurocapsa sp. SU_5_0]